MRPTPPIQETKEYRLTPEERQEVREEVRKLRPQSQYGCVMGAAFAAAKVDSTTNPKLVNRVLRVMKRNVRKAS